MPIRSPSLSIPIVALSILHGCGGAAEDPELATTGTSSTGMGAPSSTSGMPTSTAGGSESEADTGTEPVEPIEPIIITGSEFFVTQSGDDANGCTNNSNDACRTINRCLALVTQPGDGCSVEEGTYLEDASASEFYPGGCNNSGLALYPYSVCTQAAGTSEQPLVLRAAPGHERRVVIDSETPANGFVGRSGMGINHDYWSVSGFRWINSRNDAINASSMGILGGRIENNYFSDTLDCASGPNMAHVQFDAGVDWVVRNNYFGRGQWYTTADGDPQCAMANEQPSHMTAIMAFKVDNALIEHNYFAAETKTGVLWKSHFEPVVFESTIRLNEFDGLPAGLNMICCGKNKPGDSSPTARRSSWTGKARTIIQGQMRWRWA